ncbi:MAG: endonuclease/exonuclease/phosphatase family protein [Roseiflexaceae bacterium]
MRQRIMTYLARLSHAYVGVLFGWAAMRTLFGDRWWWLFCLNSFAEYLFVPLPAVFAAAWLAQRRRLWVSFGAVLALGGCLYGRMWWPKLSPAQVGDVILTVMTFNMLGYNRRPEGIVGAIHNAGADVVAIQELNTATAAYIQRDLADAYPYQVLDPHEGDSGMGVISRYPLRRVDAALPGDWIGEPQALSLNLHGTWVTLLHFHARSTDIGSIDRMATVRERERQARTLAAFAAARPEPLVALGDFNATDQSVAYTTMASVLADSWREAGWGPGHTFPGAASSGSSRHRIAGILVPKWLIRIDYIFHSPHLRAVGAWIGPWDEVSDHRSVLVRLALKHVAPLVAGAA